MKRAYVFFGGAVVLALLVGHLLRDTAGYMVRNPDGTITGDITHYVYWTRLVTLGGIQAAYGGTWPETYAVYPPINLYAYQAVGNVYRWFADPTFDPVLAQDSLWLREGIKFVALGWHLLTAAAIFLLVRRLATPLAASVAAALYVLNPAALYDVAHWAQPDGAHSLFSVLSIGLLSLGQLIAPWAAIALAALAKPQAWALVPLVVIATLRALRGPTPIGDGSHQEGLPPGTDSRQGLFSFRLWHGSRAAAGESPVGEHSVQTETTPVRDGLIGLTKGIVVAALVSGIVVLPFVVSGHLAELLSLPGVISSVMPVVSADAHNLWWLVLEPRGQDPLLVQDSARLIGPLTFRIVAGALVAGVLLLTYWLYWTRRATLAEAAALGVLGWFTFTTQAHENHLFFALPLLSLAWPSRPSLLLPFGVISVTLLLNMVLHDQFLLEGFGRGLQDPLVERLRLANAAANVLCCLGWAVLAVLRAPAAGAASATVRQWSRQSRGVGLEVASE